MNFVALGEGPTEEGQRFRSPEFIFKPLADEDHGVLHILVRRIFQEVLTEAPPTALGLPPISPAKAGGRILQGGWEAAIERLRLLVPLVRYHKAAQAVGGVSLLVAVIDKNCSLERLTQLENAARGSIRPGTAIVSCSEGSTCVLPSGFALKQASLCIVLTVFRPFTEFVLADGALPVPPPCDHRWSGYVEAAKRMFRGDATMAAARQLELSSPHASVTGLADLTRALKIFVQRE